MLFIQINSEFIQNLAAALSVSLIQSSLIQYGFPLHLPFLCWNCPGSLWEGDRKDLRVFEIASPLSTKKKVYLIMP